MENACPEFLVRLGEKKLTAGKRVSRTPSKAELLAAAGHKDHYKMKARLMLRIPTALFKKWEALIDPQKVLPPDGTKIRKYEYGFSSAGHSMSMNRSLWKGIVKTSRSTWGDDVWLSKCRAASCGTDENDTNAAEKLKIVFVKQMLKACGVKIEQVLVRPEVKQVQVANGQGPGPKVKKTAKWL